MPDKTQGLLSSALLLISPPSLPLCVCVYIHCIGLYNADGQNESRQRLKKCKRRRDGTKPYHLQKRQKMVKTKVFV